MIDEFLVTHRLPDEFKTLVEEHYQPLADSIYQQNLLQTTPYLVGVNGCQGSGKSTLSDYISEYLSKTYDLNVVVMSLDDFYYPKSKREELAETVHPLLATRGVPGTHDTSLLTHVINALRNHYFPISIPSFDKATDNPTPNEQWKVIDTPVDIVILEGWCWGVPAQSDAQLTTPLNSLEKQNDSENVWRNYANTQLHEHYQPLYKLFDYWIALQPPSFTNVYRWRLEQEQKLAEKLNSFDKNTERSGLMTPAQILHFIQHFQRLTEHAIKTMPQMADTVFFLDNERKIESITNKNINNAATIEKNQVVNS